MGSTTSRQTSSTNVSQKFEIELPKSYRIWEREYEVNRLETTNSDFTNRVRLHSLEIDIQRNERERKETKLENDRKLFSIKQTPQPLQTIFSSFRLQNVNISLPDFVDKICSKKKQLPEIDDRMNEIIQDATIPYPSSEVLVEFNGIPITRKDVQTLLKLNWLNDEVINFYLNLIVERSSQGKYKPAYTFNTFFYSKLREAGHSSIKRWTRKVDIFKFTYLIIPVHLGNHWCLAFINFNERSISYYDSLGGPTNSCCDILLDYLRDESMDKKKVEFTDENWRFINAYEEISIPQQRNGSDCGVFACTYAEFLSRDTELDFSQDDMPYFRKKMIYEIITKKLLDI